MEKAKFPQKILKALRSVWHIALAFGVLFLLVDFAGSFLKMIFNVTGYTLRISPLQDDHISAKFYILEGLDFAKVSSISVCLKRSSNSFFMIPDYNAGDFYCARASSIDHFPSGILRYIDGKPQDFVRIQPIEPLTYRVSFGSEQGKLPKPKRSLYFMAYPPWKWPSAAVSNLTIQFENGSILNVELTDSIPKLWRFLFALLLLPLLLMFDKRQTLSISDPSLKDRINSLNRTNRLFGGAVAVFLKSLNLHQFSVYGSAGYYIFSLTLTLIFLWAFFGVYLLRRTRLAVKKSPLLKLKFALVALLVLSLPVLLIGIVLKRGQTSFQKDFVNNLQFKDKQIKRDEERKVILCMGGSSTRGSPFNSKWPYDYPALLENFIRQKLPDVLVLNGGAVSASTSFAYENLPKIMDKAKIDVVTLNYLCNDSSLFLIRSISEKILFFLPEKLKRLPTGDFHRKLLVDTVNVVRKRGAACVFVLEPSFNYVYFGVDPFHNTKPIVKEVAKEMGVPLIDPSPVFAKNRDRFLFVDDVHLTRFGTELLAQVLSEEISKILEEKIRSDE